MFGAVVPHRTVSLDSREAAAFSFCDRFSATTWPATWLAVTNMGRRPAKAGSGRRTRVGEKRKGIHKSKDPLYWTEKRIERRIDRDKAKLEALRAKRNAKTPAPRTSKRARTEPAEEPVTKIARTKQDEADQRIAIRYFYRRLDSPPEEDWDGQCGAVSEIRRMMSVIGEAPGSATVHRTLERIAQDDEDLRVRRNFGRTRVLSHEDDLLVGLMIYEGYSQQMATDMLNTERAARGEDPVDRQHIRDAEKRHVELRAQAKGLAMKSE